LAAERNTVENKSVTTQANNPNEAKSNKTSINHSTGNMKNETQSAGTDDIVKSKTQTEGDQYGCLETTVGASCLPCIFCLGCWIYKERICRSKCQCCHDPIDGLFLCLWIFIDVLGGSLIPFLWMANEDEAALGLMVAELIFNICALINFCWLLKYRSWEYH